MSSLDTCGSQWRLWDLHVHIPRTHLADAYRRQDRGETPEETFCRKIAESQVDGIGITDYFDASQVVRIINMFRDRFKHSTKLLLPNVELRLTDIVNKDEHFVNYHLLFNPDTPQDLIIDCVRRIPVELRDSSGRQKECGDLNGQDFEKATVNRASLLEHLRRFFGDQTPRDAKVFTLVPAGNDGIRPKSGSLRRRELALQIEGEVDGILGNSNDRAWFLRPDRYKGHNEPNTPRPVFKGSDAHSFQELDDRWAADAIAEYTTWIKADLTYEGLRQTLLEPDERVRIGGPRPDSKDPFKWIRRVTFSGVHFPEEVQLSENLTSIIGSRSSGKSALLAHIAHAVSPELTEASMTTKNGPAAGVSWADAAAEDCEIEWAAPGTVRGKVIYVPQNALYALSERPDEITSRIRPIIERRFEAHTAVLAAYENSVRIARTTVARDIENWLTSNAAASEAHQAAANIGDPIGSKQAMAELDETIRQRVTDVDNDRVATYSSLMADIDARRQAATNAIEVERTTGPASVDISVSPGLDVPGLAHRVETLVEDARQRLASEIEEVRNRFSAEQREVVTHADSEELELRAQHSDVVAALAVNTAATQAMKDRRNLEKKLGQIRGFENQSKMFETQQRSSSGHITGALEFVAENLANAEELFMRDNPLIDTMRISLEAGFAPNAEEIRAQGINKTRDSPFVDRGQGVDIEKAQSNVEDFLLSLTSGHTVLNAGSSVAAVAAAILGVHRDARLVAELDGDRIGGFSSSSMTPGKQALFALTLLLGEDGDGWPLLLDQPEDDLDSRSIYDQLVPYLLKRKRERQIILVSHNANLVVGADSECVVVANRHGSDRPNHRERTFDYRTGSLEDTFVNPGARGTLARQGVREHVCQLLDGGPEAFQRRSRKYRLHK